VSAIPDISSVPMTLPRCALEFPSDVVMKALRPAARLCRTFGASRGLQWPKHSLAGNVLADINQNLIQAISEDLPRRVGEILKRYGCDIKDMDKYVSVGIQVVYYPDGSAQPVIWVEPDGYMLVGICDALRYCKGDKEIEARKASILMFAELIEQDTTVRDSCEWVQDYLLEMIGEEQSEIADLEQQKAKQIAQAEKRKKKLAAAAKKARKNSKDKAKVQEEEPEDLDFGNIDEQIESYGLNICETEEALDNIKQFKEFFGERPQDKTALEAKLGGMLDKLNPTHRAWAVQVLKFARLAEAARQIQYPIRDSNGEWPFGDDDDNTGTWAGSCYFIWDEEDRVGMEMSQSLNENWGNYGGPNTCFNASSPEDVEAAAHFMAYMRWKCNLMVQMCSAPVRPVKTKKKRRRQ